MQADPCIIAGNNPAVFRGFRANNFIFAGLRGNLLGCEVNFPSSGFCPSGPSLSDKVYSWISSQFTKCSLFCKTLLCLIQPSHSAERLFVPDLLDRHAWGGLVSPVLTAGQMI